MDLQDPGEPRTPAGDGVRAQPVFQRAVLRAHLATCQSCRCYLHQVDQTVAVLRETPSEPVPEASLNRLITVFCALKK